MSNNFCRAADWKLDAPDWSGRMRITAKGKAAYVKLEDKISGMTLLGLALKTTLKLYFYSKIDTDLL